MSEFGGIFVFCGYDENTLSYENCRLTKRVGDYEVGHLFYNIILVPTEGTLEFYESIHSDVATMVKKLMVD